MAVLLMVEGRQGGTGYQRGAINSTGSQHSGQRSCSSTSPTTLPNTCSPTRFGRVLNNGYWMRRDSRDQLAASGEAGRFVPERLRD